MMTMTDIDRKVSEITARLISEGYMIDLEASAGHQGEVGKVFLYNPENDKLLGIFIESTHDLDLDQDILVLSVKGWCYGAHYRSSKTIWINEFDTTYESYTYYTVVTNKQGVRILTESFDEYHEIKEKKDARWLNRHQDNRVKFTDPKYMEIATRYIKRTYGLKRVSWDRIVIRKDIHPVFKTGTYYIIYNHEVNRLG